MELGDRLADLLEENDISHKEFAKQLNIAPTTLSGYITNNRHPDYNLLCKMADALGVSTDYLLGHNCDSITITLKENSLLNQIRHMNVSQQKMIYLMVETITKANEKNST